MNIPDVWAPLLVSSVRDAVLYQKNLLLSDTVKNSEDYEEHIVALSELLEYIKSEYKNIEDEVGLPLNKIL